MKVIRSHGPQGSAYLRASEGSNYFEIMFRPSPGGSRMRIESLRHENGAHLFEHALAALVKQAQAEKRERVTTEYMVEEEAKHLEKILAFKKRSDGTYHATVEALAKRLKIPLKSVEIEEAEPPPRKTRHRPREAGED